MRRLFIGLLAVILTVGGLASHSSRASAEIPIDCCYVTSSTPSPSPTPPEPVLLAYQYSAGNVSYGTQTAYDVGADNSTYDSQLYWGEESLSQAGSVDNAEYSDCNGSCHSFIYTEPTRLTCQPAVTGTYSSSGYSGSQTGSGYGIDGSYWEYLHGGYGYGGPHDAGFYHPYPGPPSSSSHVTYPNSGSGGQGYCNSSGTTYSGVGNPQADAFNPLDTTGTACFYNLVATSSSSCGWQYTGPWASITSGQGLSFDNWDDGYNDPGTTSSEFGNNYLFDIPSGTYGASEDWETAKALQINSLCGTVCFPIVSKTSMNISSCNTTITFDGGTHCANSTIHYCGACIDNRVDLDDFCTNLTENNFLAFLVELAVERDAAVADSVQQGDIAMMLNTIAWIQANHTGDECANLHWADEEGSDAAYYMEAMGVIWLAPSADGTPDEISPWFLNILGAFGVSGASTDVSYFPMYELVPYGPEEAPQPFVFNGTSTSSANGTWCNSATTEVAPNENSGDSGGVSGLVQWCPQKYEPIYVIQYHHMRILQGSDMGPTAVVVNASTVPESIQSNWFQVDPASTYKHVISFPLCTYGYYHAGVTTNYTVPCEGAYIPSGYAGALFNALTDVNTQCQDAETCAVASGAYTASNMITWTTPFSPASAQSNCTDGNTCVQARSATFLTSQ